MQLLGTEVNSNNTSCKQCELLRTIYYGYMIMEIDEKCSQCSHVVIFTLLAHKDLHEHSHATIVLALKDISLDIMACTYIPCNYAHALYKALSITRSSWR